MRTLSCLLVAAACGPTTAEKTEADRVSRAVDALRTADNSAKRPRLKALELASCRLKDVCDVKSICVEAYRLHVRGLEATAAAGRSVKTDAAAPGVAKLLKSAEADLAAAEVAAKRCVDRQGDLKRKYKLQ